jgi:cytochrome bd-type quinol oxidase subunit 2
VQPFKLLVVVMLVAIVVSLGSALYHLVHDRDGQTKSMVRALTVRISLSVALFILLFIAYAAGWIQPHGVRP